MPIEVNQCAVIQTVFDQVSFNEADACLIDR